MIVDRDDWHVNSCLGFQKADEVDPKLMLPVFDILCPFLPEKIRAKLRLGVRYRRDSDEVRTNPVLSLRAVYYFDRL